MKLELKNKQLLHSESMNYSILIADFRKTMGFRIFINKKHNHYNNNLTNYWYTLPCI